MMPDAPLTGVRFVELGGIGPIPHAGMLLADLGAQGVRIDRPGQLFGHIPGQDPLLRGREIRSLDLRSDEGRSTVLDLIAESDVLIEGFRPGTAERLGLGPRDCWERNPGLVYGRMTGWGQDGPWSARAGHDINYSGIAGTLRHTARSGERPVLALNLLADHGGGSLYLVNGVLAALIEVARTGKGVVVDAAMIEGAASLMSLVYGMRAQGKWPNPPGQNILDGGCPFYDTYACSDGEFVAVGALESPFYAALLTGLELVAEDLPSQWDEAGWPVLREIFTREFGARTREHWEVVFGAGDACVTPVLSIAEASAHPQFQARGSFVSDAITGDLVPGPAPRFGPRAQS